MRLSTMLSMVLITAPSFVSAQSVLERVLGQIDGATSLAQINGTYANIAENIGLTSVYYQTEPAGLSEAASFEEPIYIAQVWEGDDDTGDGYWVSTEDLGQTIPPSDSGLSVTIIVSEDGDISFPEENSEVLYVYSGSNDWTWEVVERGDVHRFNPDLQITLQTDDDYYFNSAAWNEENNSFVAEAFTIQVPYVDWISSNIDGSINNVLDGIDGSTQEALAGLASATEWSMPTFDLGDMATTALGAVNTGEITLGVNSAVDEASTATTNAISAVVDQIGGSADTGALVLNVASNAGAINGSINNVIAEINGSVGNLSTTALGAVNTGTIVSGVDAAVQGIVGVSGQTGL